jgi:hypothetical protein
MKSEAGDVQVLGTNRDFQQLQDAHALSEMARSDFPRLSSEVNLFKTFVSEPVDHSQV